MTQLFYFVLCYFLFSASNLFANKLPLPADLFKEVLSEATPSAFSLDGITIDDFDIELSGDLPEGFEAKIEPQSLQWVRVIDVLVLPKARMNLKFKKPTTVRISYGGFSTGGSNLTKLDFPIVLSANKKNEVTLRFEMNGIQKQGNLYLKLKTKLISNNQRVYIDSSCSRYDLKAKWKNILPQTQNQSKSWIYMGCRFLTSNGNLYRTSGLEIYIWWDGMTNPSTISIDGINTEATEPSLWALRLGAQPSKINLKNNENENMDLNFTLSDKHSLGSLGLGIGPYFSEFNGVQEHDQGYSPLLTFYGSLFINESLRIVSFDATSISNREWTDFGFYLCTENAKMLDQRLTMNLLFGGHIIGFRTAGRDHAIPSTPQGFEFIYSDAFIRGKSLSVGGFIYPEINGRSYYNLWLRWGGRIFGEINYLSAKETFETESVSSKSLGITIGFPITRFL